MRAFFAARGVMELDTPVLGHTTVTDPAIESLTVEVGDRRIYLQTSPEYHLKRALAAGAPSVVRIGPVFRADESGRLHNPEFTMVEWYRLGFDLDALMTETAALADLILGAGKYRRTEYAALLEPVGVDVFTSPRATLEQALRSIGVGDEVRAWSRRHLLDYLVAHVLGSMTGRVFVTAYPPEQAALARVVSDAAGRRVAARFELVIDGIEIANGYDELRDADVLAARMAGDIDARRAHGQPLHAADQRLLAAMRHGLPACAGVALGFDRLLMLAERAKALADVLPFDYARS